MLTSNTRQYGFAAALEGIEEATRAAGFALGVRVVESGTPSDVRDAVERAIEPAGALIVIAYDRAGIAALRAVPPDVPMAAMVETPSGDEAAGKPWVWFDDRKAARDATNYLLGLGHKTVHYVSIPSSTSTSQRMLGWRSALEDAGVRVPKPLQAGWDPQSSSQAAQHRLTRDPKVTAVLCGNDDLAIGVMRAMHQAGRAIPDDVSIVGFDDTPLAAFYIPALTTVRQDFAALGKACFAKLLSLLDANASQDAHPWPQAELIVRESAGPPPAAAASEWAERLAAALETGADGRKRWQPAASAGHPITRPGAGRNLRSRARANQEDGERSITINPQRT